MDQVARHIKNLRKRAGLTQDGLAERMNVTRQTVSSWETGRTQPDIETLSALAEVLGTDVNGLIYGPKPVEGVWRRYQKKYLVWTLAGAAETAGRLRCLPAPDGAHRSLALRAA